MANVKQLVETLPVADRPGRSEQRLADATLEERMTSLFRRWPALTEHEAAELRRLWEARVQQAKQG